MKSWTIYGLHDPRTGAIRYVGYTTESPTKRLKRHIARATNEQLDLPICRWIRKLYRLNLFPFISELEHGAGEWQSRERWWIAHMRLSNPDMLNVGDGGEFSVPPEARKRAGEKLKNRYFSPEHRAKISAAKIGRKRPEMTEILKQSKTFQAAMKKRIGIKMNLTNEERKRRAESCLKNRGARWGWKDGAPND